MSNVVILDISCSAFVQFLVQKSVCTIVIRLSGGCSCGTSRSPKTSVACRLASQSGHFWMSHDPVLLHFWVPKIIRTTVFRLSEGRSCVTFRSPKNVRSMRISVRKWVIFGANVVLCFSRSCVFRPSSFFQFWCVFFAFFDIAHFHDSTLCFSCFSFIIRPGEAVLGAGRR